MYLHFMVFNTNKYYIFNNYENIQESLYQIKFILIALLN